MIKIIRTISLLIPLTFLILYYFFSYLNITLDKKSFLTLYVGLWMIYWWVTGFLPLGITALLPLIIFPTFKIMTIQEVSSKYLNPVIFLFLGGFMLARALEKTELNKRISLKILSLTGHSDKGIVVGFIIATGFLSMWISNTATAVMMLPVAMSVMKFLKEHSHSTQEHFKSMSTVVYLSIAYSANIGGVMTPIGTPPNVVFVGYLNDLFHQQIDFWKWIVIFAPLGALILMCQFYLLKWIFPFNIQISNEFKAFVKTQLDRLGPLNTHQKITLFIFILTCLLWITKDIWNYFIKDLPLNDSSIAITAGLLLFMLPFNKKLSPVLEKSDIDTLPWNIVLLFGGGMALAEALEKAGLIEFATQSIVSLGITSPYVLIFLLTAMALLLTELMSNVALCVVALPVIMRLGETYGVSPILIGLPAAIATSFAFTMPISTPPNAIVFGTNEVQVKDMMKAGLILNIVSLLLLMTLGWALINLFFK